MVPTVVMLLHDFYTVTYHKEIALAKIGATHCNAYLELLDKVREKVHKHNTETL